ncbi:MAG: gamma carbonic anhydrase family protein [Phycisphaeraceae bacterium]
MSVKKINDAYIADTARVIGDVKLGRDVNVWYGAAIRGDVAPIVIGEGTNIQDNAVIHCDHKVANVIGCHVVIGHGAIVHGMSVGDGTLIGMGAVVLGRTKIGRNCLIAAGAVVPPGLEVPDGMVVMGVPGKIVRETNDKEKAYMAKLPPHYVKLAKRHVERPDEPWVFERDEIENPPAGW